MGQAAERGGIASGLVPETVSVESNTPTPPPAPTDTATVVEVVLMVGVEAAVHTDASAAIGIVRRTGLAKLRRLNVRYLCFQE